MPGRAIETLAEKTPEIPASGTTGQPELKSALTTRLMTKGNQKDVPENPKNTATAPQREQLSAQPQYQRAYVAPRPYQKPRSGTGGPQESRRNTSPSSLRNGPEEEDWDERRHPETPSIGEAGRARDCDGTGGGT